MRFGHFDVAWQERFGHVITAPPPIWDQAASDPDVRADLGEAIKAVIAAHLKPQPHTPAADPPP